MNRPSPPSVAPPSPRSLALLAVGLLLVANGSYLYPNGNPVQEVSVYESRAVEELPAERLDAVLNCNSAAVESQRCAVAERLRAEGPLRVGTDAAVGPAFVGYEYAAVGGSLSRPAPRVENGTLVLALEPADTAAAKRSLATAYADAPAAVRTAVAEGRVRTTETVPESEQYVRRAGTDYLLERDRTFEQRVSTGPLTPPADAIPLLRAGGWLAGLALVWTAGRRAA